MLNIPKVTKVLLLSNLAVFLLSGFMGDSIRGHSLISDIYGLHFLLAPDFHFWQLFTYMFIHDGFMHLFGNMFALWMFGCIIERVWGPKRFLFYYILCGVGAGLFQEAAQFAEYYSQGFVSLDQMINLTGSNGEVIETITVADYVNLWTTVGASGAVYAILLAFGMLFPEERLFIFPLPFPIKAKWFVLLYAGAELFFAFSSSNDHVAHLAHLGGMVIGFFMIRYWRRRAGWGGNTHFGQQFFDVLRSNWESRTRRNSNRFGGTRTSDDSPRWGDRQSDWDYNAQRREQQDEIDRILDKIRRSGYDSLTKDEKQKLFDQSR